MMEEQYDSFDATGTIRGKIWTGLNYVQIIIDADLPQGDKLLALSAPYRSPLSQNEFVIKTIDSFLFWLLLLFNILQVVSWLQTTVLHGGEKLPHAHLRVGNNCYCCR